MKIIKQIILSVKKILEDAKRPSWERYLESSKDIYELEYRQRQLDKRDNFGYSNHRGM